MAYDGWGGAVGLGEGDHRAPRPRIVVGQLAECCEVQLSDYMLSFYVVLTKHF